MTRSQHARAIHAAHPHLSIATIGRMTHMTPSKVRNALARHDRRISEGCARRRVLLTPELSRLLQAEAAATGRAINSLIREAIGARYERQKECAA